MYGSKELKRCRTESKGFACRFLHLEKMTIIEKYKEYLENKHKGGLNSKKGSSYEDYYATYQIANLLHLYADYMENVKVSGQMPYTFLDDLVIELPKERIYHQIKDVKGLSWITGNKTNTLEEDFVCQKSCCEEKNENFKLRLVYSDEKCSACNSIPDSLKNCTELIYFKSEDDINACILSNQQFLEALSNISVDKRKDKLTDLGMCILGIWCGCRQMNENFQYFYEQIQKMSKAGISLTKFTSLPMSDKCATILNNIGIKSEISGNLFRWNYRMFNGSLSWSIDTDNKICQESPKDFLSFLSIINQF